MPQFQLNLKRLARKKQKRLNGSPTSSHSYNQCSAFIVVFVRNWN
jgi:hypothetical protein